MSEDVVNIGYIPQHEDEVKDFLKRNIERWKELETRMGCMECRLTEGEHHIDDVIRYINVLKSERECIDPMGWLHVIFAMIMIGVMCISKAPITT